MNYLFFCCLMISVTGISIDLKLQTKYSSEIENRNTSVALVRNHRFTPLSDSALVPYGPHHISKRFVHLIILGVAAAALIGVLVICSIFCTGQNPAQVSNKKPEFTFCPSYQEYFAILGETYIIVTWPMPIATDEEDKSPSLEQTRGPPPGSSFYRGSHSIVYSATDSHGDKAHCSFSFKVSVITCNPIIWPNNGYVDCDKSEFIYGSFCTVQCAKGYELDPPSTEPYRIMCNKSITNKGILDKAVPQCKAITCPNATVFDIKNGSPVCNDRNHKYDSSCKTQCDRGYGLTSGIIFSTCQEDKTWSTDLPDCEDIEPPEITYCPQTIYAYTERLRQTALVTWTQPTATDNSGLVAVLQTRGEPPGSYFRLGRTEIRYQANDTNNNKKECIFFINVEEIRCDPPLITDTYLLYQCADRYTYGSTCHLKCMGSFPLIGNDTITCERNDSFTPPLGYWDMGEFQPYCLKNPCDQLPAPENGAMACDKWMFGMQCQMQCSDKYDIPYGIVGSSGVPFTGLFTCSESTGKYSPSNTVPGCTEKRRPGMTTVLGEFFYYIGDCNDSTVLQDIKENFIKQMQLLEANGWNGMCPTEIDCNVNNTQVTCGAISGKKRDVHTVLDYLRSKRSTHEIRVEITLATTWYDFNSTAGSTFYFLEEVQKDVFNVMKELAISGNLTVGDLNPDANSFTLGYSSPDCPEGNIVRWSTLTCVPCSSGTYLDSTSDPMNPGCKDCPVGTYKEIPEDVSCIPCPSGTSTETTGSKNITNCLRKCSPGEFSKTGLEPCHLCPKSFYQTDEMSTACLPCPFGKTTAFSGSKWAQNCSDFDIKFSEAKQKIEMYPPVTDQKSFSLSTWIAVPKNLANFSLFRSESSIINIDVNYMEFLNIRINSQLLSTGVTVLRDTWSHVTVQIDSDNQTASVYVDGSKVYSSSVSSSVPLASALITETSVLSIMLNEASNAGYLISGYNVEFSKLTEIEIATLANACHSFRKNVFISMDTFVNMSHIQTTFASPSSCDNINRCYPDPCNGHPCLDKINSFKCLCENGYTGDLCQNQPDYCKDNPCKNNGTCSNSDGNFTCLCPVEYKGNKCQFLIVNGGWSPWTSFSECSVSCAGGVKTRSRQCNSPVPDPDGLPCDANGANETVPCNTDDCPSCLPLRKGFGNIASCAKNPDGHDICTISCRPGYVFIAQNQPLPEYVCGPNTSYEWNGRPPSCGRANSPRSISVLSSVQYNPEIPCINADTASSKLKAELETSLSCAVNGSCSVNVTSPGCPSSGRSTSSSQTIILTQTFASGDNLNLEALEDSNNVSKPLYDLLMGINSLEASAQQINSSHSILEFEINGVQYTSTAVSIDSVVQCPSGQGRREAFCVDCPLGTFSDSGTCKLCSIGTYQDESGQSSCKLCTNDFKTKYLGSQNVTDCSDNSSSVTTQSSDSDLSVKRVEDSSNVLVISIAVTAVILSIAVAAVVWMLVNKQAKRKKFRLSHTRDEISTVNESCASLNMITLGLNTDEIANIPLTKSTDGPANIRFKCPYTSEL